LARARILADAHVGLHASDGAGRAQLVDQSVSFAQRNGSIGTPDRAFARITAEYLSASEPPLHDG
jgi:hypothetical protein